MTDASRTSAGKLIRVLELERRLDELTPDEQREHAELLDRLLRILVAIEPLLDL